MPADNLIRTALDVTGWSQADLARRLGVHKQTVQDWVQGRMQPRGGVYVDLHRELIQMQVEIDTLLDKLKERSAES